MSALLKLLILILQIPMKPKSWKFGLLRNKIIIFGRTEHSETFTDWQPHIESFRPQKFELLYQIQEFILQEGPIMQYPRTKMNVEWNGTLVKKIPVNKKSWKILQSSSSTILP